MVPPRSGTLPTAYADDVNMLVTSSTEINQVDIESRVCEMKTGAKMNRAVGFGWVQGREFYFPSFFSLDGRVVQDYRCLVRS